MCWNKIQMNYYRNNLFCGNCSACGPKGGRKEWRHSWKSQHASRWIICGASLARKVKIIMKWKASHSLDRWWFTRCAYLESMQWIQMTTKQSLCTLAINVLYKLLNGSSTSLNDGWNRVAQIWGPWLEWTGVHFCVVKISFHRLTARSPGENCGAIHRNSNMAKLKM